MGKNVLRKHFFHTKKKKESIKNGKEGREGSKEGRKDRKLTEGL